MKPLGMRLKEKLSANPAVVPGDDNFTHSALPHMNNNNPVPI